MRRRILVLLLALALAGLAPASALAHGGILLGNAIAGPYRTSVTAAPLVERGRPQAIDVTVYLSTVASNTPISDATVTTTVQADGRTVRPKVTQIAGGYEAIVPVKNAFTVGRQTIDVDIRGPLGTGHLQVRPFEADSGPPVVLIAASVVVLLALCLFAVRVRRRRIAAGPPGEDRWPTAPEEAL